MHICISRDHLRVCGADRRATRRCSTTTGSPPRVRSRQAEMEQEKAEARITSACAEQTTAGRNCRRVRGDHLRVCGADISARAVHEGDEGSPPRVRSRRQFRQRSTAARGITSACAEQTRCDPAGRAGLGDHLRVCGADGHNGARTILAEGSPPRVRSRRWIGRRYARRIRITSACAEQTSIPYDKFARCRDHLRVCGADKSPRLRGNARSGSPPRVRSRHLQKCAGHFRHGITSACAEQTIRRV